jgi:hypothetical protein
MTQIIRLSRTMCTWKGVSDRFGSFIVKVDVGLSVFFFGPAAREKSFLLLFLNRTVRHVQYYLYQ